IQAVAAATGAIGAEDRRTGKRQVSNRVERLVAHELVGVAKAFAVDDAVVADGNGILERSAERQTGGPQPLNVLHEAEGAGAREFTAERAGIHIQLDFLPADQGAVEVDLDVEVEAIMRGQLARGPSVLDAHGFQYLQVAPRSVELDQPHFVDGLDEL